MAEERLKLFAQMLIVAVLSVAIISQISPSIVEQQDDTPTQTDLILDSRLNGQQLQVKPASGQPTPLDAPLQSSSGNTDQSAQGDLQKPRQNLQLPDANQNLQPNAGIDGLPEDLDI